MRSLSISLRGLVHPLVLGSVGLLLINDHLLKASVPSVITGKLSDLAGLFFFPFLLAVPLGLLLDPVLPNRRLARRTAALAFGLTALWFTGVKTCAWANDATVAALAPLRGGPVQIVRDPTDLVALVVLWPAWRLWRHLERAPSRPPGRAAYLALGLASLATVATAPAAPAPHVVRVVVSEPSVYVRLAYDGGGAPRYARSDDGGRTWKVADSPGYSSSDPAVVPDRVTQQLLQPVRLPVTVCDPKDARTCYRIVGPERVEASADGGQTWQVAWQLPRGRRMYMERYVANNPRMQVGKRDIDLGPYDLALLPWNGGTRLVVAMGNEGILVRDETGRWSRVGIVGAMPTPYADGKDFNVLFFLLSCENSSSLLVAILVWVACCVLGWRTILPTVRWPDERSNRWAMSPLYWAGGLMVLCVPFAYLLGLGFLPLSIAAAGLLFVGPALVWGRIVMGFSRPRMARQVAWRCLWAAAGVFPLAWLPFVLWVYGVIPAYWTALVLSVLVGSLAVGGGILLVRRASRAAKAAILSPETQTGTAVVDYGVS